MPKVETFNEYDWNYAEAIAEAEAGGFTIIHSRPTLLLLDLDTAESVEQYRRMLPLLANRLKLTELSFYTSQSGKHVHAVLACKALDMPSRIAAQAAMGSDPKREALALCMHLNGVENCSWLFKPPAKA